MELKAAVFPVADHGESINCQNKGTPFGLRIKTEGQRKQSSAFAESALELSVIVSARQAVGGAKK